MAEDSGEPNESRQALENLARRGGCAGWLAILLLLLVAAGAVWWLADGRSSDDASEGTEALVREAADSGELTVLDPPSTVGSTVSEPSADSLNGADAANRALCDAWDVRVQNTPTVIPYSPADFEQSLVVEAAFYNLAATLLDPPESSSFAAVATWYESMYVHFEPYGFDSSGDDYYVIEVVEKAGADVPQPPLSESLDALAVVEARCDVTITQE